MRILQSINREKSFTIDVMRSLPDGYRDCSFEMTGVVISTPIFIGREISNNELLAYGSR